MAFVAKDSISRILSLGALRVRIGWIDLPELITVTEDQIHMLVKSFKGANEDTAILQDAPHPVVDVLQHLAALAHGLQGEIRKNGTQLF